MIGDLKYLDQAVDAVEPIVKNGDEAAEMAADILKKNGLGDIVEDIIQNSDEAAEIGEGIVKSSDEAADAARAAEKSNADVVKGKEVAAVKEVTKESLDLAEKNIDEFIAGNKSFEDVLDDYAKIYADKVNSNEWWSWNDSIKGGKSLVINRRN